MELRRLAGITLALVAGCGFEVAGGGSVLLDGGTGDPDAPDDGGGPPIDAAPACFGATGSLVTLCLTGALPPTFAVATATTLDTGTSPLCAPTTGASAAASCVIAAATIDITARLTVTGPRPLIFAGDTIRITGAGIVDVASHRGGTRGPGADPTECAAGTAATSYGGGAGGSFTGAGGGGGAITGGSAGAVTATPTLLRGGCPGGMGGRTEGGAGGAGGGAIALIARGDLTIAGVINASGAGGSGATASVDGGGGGGGAGGMIVLDAPQIALTGQVFASGAGGGEGADDVAGLPGQDPPDATTLPLGGYNANTGAGEGGDGTTGAVRTGSPGADRVVGFVAGGGGGGGGAGFIRILGTRTGSGPVSPPPT